MMQGRFREIFEAELGFVCRILRRLGVAERDVADVAQELFLAVSAKVEADSAAGGEGRRSWLYAFCLRYAANYRRLARHRAQDGLDHAPTVAARDDDAATRDLVLRALGALDDVKREALVLHDMEGLSAPEIAELTGAPLNTVYSRVRLAREDFRRAVGMLEGARHA